MDVMGRIADVVGRNAIECELVISIEWIGRFVSECYRMGKRDLLSVECPFPVHCCGRHFSEGYICNALVQ